MSILGLVVIVSLLHFSAYLTTSLYSTSLLNTTATIYSPFLGQEKRNNENRTRITTPLNAPSLLNDTATTTIYSPFLGHEERNNEKRSRIKKCCPKGHRLFEDISKNGQTEFKYFCAEETNRFEVGEHSWKIYNSQFDSEPIFSLNEWDEIGAFDGTRNEIPNCTNLKVLENGEEIWFRVLENGEIFVGLHFWVHPIWLKVTKQSGYCLDFSAQPNFHQRPSQGLVFCDLDDYQTYRLHRLLYGVTFTVSATFLTFTVVIFLMVKRGLGPNIHSWLQFSYFFALLLFYVAEGARIWVKFDGLHIKLGAGCFYHAVVAQYFSIVFIFTLFSLAAHMLYTFWKMKPLNSARKRPKGRDITFLIMLPWIIPFLGLLGGLIYNHFTNVKASQQEVGIFEFGHFRCASPAWFVGTALYTLFFILNTVYFIATAAVISATIYKSGRKKLASDTFRLLLKICLLMGIFFGSTVYEISFGREAAHPLHWLWAFSRIAFFGLQGFWLFVAFGWSSGHRTALGCTSFQDVINMFKRISFKRRGTVSTTANGTTASIPDCDPKSV